MLTEMPFKAQRLKTFIPTSVTDNLMVGDYGVVVHTNLDLDLFKKNKNKEPGHETSINVKSDFSFLKIPTIGTKRNCYLLRFKI